MLPVVSGLGLVALAWPLRTLIGRREALFYALLVTLSPTLCYYSRALRHDVPIAFFTMAALVAFLHFVRSGRVWQAYATGVAIGLAAATKEDIYLTAFTFANALWIVGLLRSDGAEPTVLRRARVWTREILGWLARHWIPIATAVIAALTIALTLYTSLFTHPSDWNATVKALSYWWGQHTAKRIGGPWWYYLPIEIGYESLSFFPAAAIALSWFREGAPSRVDSLFLVWALISFALYAWAQEKVPWLLVPALLPQTVLAAAYFADIGLLRLVLWSPVAALTVWSLVASSYLYDAPRTSEAAESAHFEPIVYVQSTYDVPSVLAEIESTGRKLGTGKKTSLVVVGDATWPLSWYLRDYNVYWNSFPPRPTPRSSSAIPPIRSGSARTSPTTNAAPLRGARLVGDRGESSSLENVVRFLAERRVWNPTGTTDAVLFVTKNAAPHAVLPTVRLRPAPRTESYAGGPVHSAGRPLGGPGAGPGQFTEPRGIAIDREGNLLVADSGNNRIQKLDAEGNPIAAWGGPAAGDGRGEFRQPSGIAAAEDGTIYVADTWNHRIVKLDANGNFLLEWREENPALYGPRALAIAPDGTVFVADTGEQADPRLRRERQPVVFDRRRRIRARQVHRARRTRHRSERSGALRRRHRQSPHPGVRARRHVPARVRRTGMAGVLHRAVPGVARGTAVGDRFVQSPPECVRSFRRASLLDRGDARRRDRARAADRRRGGQRRAHHRVGLHGQPTRALRFPNGLSAAAPAKIESPGALH